MLKEILAQMLAEANAEKGKKIVRKLKGNLHLMITAFENNIVFEISRDSIFPSDQEWKTCLACFPYFIGNPQAERKSNEQGRPALRAYLPQEKKIVMF